MSELLGRAGRLGALPAVCLLCWGNAIAAEVQVEWSAGGGIGSSFTRRAPFAFDGLTFAGPYAICPPELSAGQCLFNGLGDVVYALEVEYPLLVGGGLDARVTMGGPFSVGVGLSGGVSNRHRRLLRTPGSEVLRGRAAEPDELRASAERHIFLRSDGVDALAYLHGGLRWTHGIGGRTPAGSRSRLKNVFVELGAGWLPVVPGGDAAAMGRPLAAHGQAGVTLRHGARRSFTLSVRHIRALASRDEALLIDSAPAWTTVQLGWISGR